jgi:hypothetical protein
MMDVFWNVLCGFLPGILGGAIGMSWLKRQYDMKGWVVAKEYKDLYDQLMESTTALQDAIQENNDE